MWWGQQQQKTHKKTVTLVTLSPYGMHCFVTVSFHTPSDSHSVQLSGESHNDKNKWVEKSTHKGVNQRSKYETQVRQQRPESPTVTLTWHACKYKVRKLHQRYILKWVEQDHDLLLGRKLKHSANFIGRLRLQRTKLSFVGSLLELTALRDANSGLRFLRNIDYTSPRDWAVKCRLFLA